MSDTPELAPTPKDVLLTDGTAKLYRFRGPASPLGPPVFLVPSIINRWYVLDLRKGASLAQALVEGGLRVYLLDWGVPEDEDRYLSWDDLVQRLHRLFYRACKDAGVSSMGLLGYCMGATISAIAAAREPDRVSAFVDLAGPIDFSQAGHLKEMTDPRWFNAHALTEAGNVSARQMQSGFVALRPTQQIAKWVGFADRAHDLKARESFSALEAWAGDNVPFPAAAYERYIRELYQANDLVNGNHWVLGERIDLGRIKCPVLTIVAERDNICPPKAATALNTRVGSTDTEILTIPGGHVGAVVGSAAVRSLYPKLVSWFHEKLAPPATPRKTRASA